MKTLVSSSTRFFFFQVAISVMFRNTLFCGMFLSMKFWKAESFCLPEVFFGVSSSSSYLLSFARESCCSRRDGAFLIYSNCCLTWNLASSFSLLARRRSSYFYFSSASFLSFICFKCLSYLALICSALTLRSAAWARISCSFTSSYTSCGGSSGITCCLERVILGVSVLLPDCESSFDRS